MKRPLQSVCPKGHRPPIVQKVHSKGEVWYCCTRCGVEWRYVVYAKTTEAKAAAESGADR